MSVLDVALTQIALEEAAARRRAARARAVREDWAALERRMCGRWWFGGGLWQYCYDLVETDAYRASILAEMIERHPAAEDALMVRTEFHTVAVPLGWARGVEGAVPVRLVRATRPSTSVWARVFVGDDARDSSVFVADPDGNLYANYRGRTMFERTRPMEAVVKYAATVIRAGAAPA